MSAKYIFVTGGVVSSFREGNRGGIDRLPAGEPRDESHPAEVRSVSECRPGDHVAFQHGEVFVTDDGAETDLDLGHYERFTHANAVATITDHRPHLRAHHCQRTAWRLSG